MNGILNREVSEDTVERYWWFSLGAGLAVIGVMALLLDRLLKTAMDIQHSLTDVWQVGKLIANNTVHTPLLGHTNQILDGTLEAAQGIEGATERIERATANIARGEG